VGAPFFGFCWVHGGAWCYSAAFPAHYALSTVRSRLAQLAGPLPAGLGQSPALPCRGRPPRREFVWFRPTGHLGLRPQACTGNAVTPDLAARSRPPAPPGRASGSAAWPRSRSARAARPPCGCSGLCHHTGPSRWNPADPTASAFAHRPGHGQSQSQSQRVRTLAFQPARCRYRGILRGC
jgi:hypothetical protein